MLDLLTMAHDSCLAEVTVISACQYTLNIRAKKLVRCLAKEGCRVTLFAWDRDGTSDPNVDVPGVKVRYVVKGYGGSRVVKCLGYLLFMWRILVYVARKKPGSPVAVAINLPCAFPVYVGSLFSGSKYIYDIADELAKSWNFPVVIKTLILLIDKSVSARASLLVHVDQWRVRPYDTKYEIIHNRPMYDAFSGVYKQGKLDPVIAVVGWLKETRGLQQLIRFAFDNTSIRLLVIGEVDAAWSRQLAALGNVTVHGHCEQRVVFELIKDCCFIMCLYDPAIEINRLASSNKLYDGMMLGVPIVTNRGISTEKIVRESNIGIIVNYQYDESWRAIVDTIADRAKLRELARRAREEWEKLETFDVEVRKKIIPHLLKQPHPVS